MQPYVGVIARGAWDSCAAYAAIAVRRSRSTSPRAQQEDARSPSDRHCRFSLREKTFARGATAIVASRSARGRSFALQRPLSPLAPREGVPSRCNGHCRFSLREKTFVRRAMAIVASRSARRRSFAERTTTLAARSGRPGLMPRAIMSPVCIFFGFIRLQRVPKVFDTSTRRPERA